MFRTINYHLIKRGWLGLTPIIFIIITAFVIGCSGDPRTDRELQDDEAKDTRVVEIHDGPPGVRCFVKTVKGYHLFHDSFFCIPAEKP